MHIVFSFGAVESKLPCASITMLAVYVLAWLENHCLFIEMLNAEPAEALV